MSPNGATLMGSATFTRLTAAFTGLAMGDIDKAHTGQVKPNFKVTNYAYEDESPGLEKAQWNRYVSFLSLNICVCK